MIEAVHPIQIDFKSLSNTCKVVDNLHMQWMCIWMCPYLITAAFSDQAFWKSPRILGNSLARRDGEVRPFHPIQIDFKSLSNTCKVIDNLHMQWMCIWMCPYHITAAFSDQAFWKSPRILGNTPWLEIMVKCDD